MVAKKKSTKKKTTKKKVKKSIKKITKKTTKKVVKKRVKKSSKKIVKKTTKKKVNKKSTVKKATNKGQSTKGIDHSKSKGKKRNYSEIDRSILDLLTLERNGILMIYDIEEKLKLKGEELSKALKRLERKEKISTKAIMDNSKWVTEVKKIQKFDEEKSIKKKVNKLTWETENDLPCLICPQALKCNDGQEIYNPKKCPYLTDWLISCIKKEPFTGNPFHPNYVK
ncbi:MAG: hypothetical protein ACTSVU_06745 [Promethearchaeota archaeon]